MAVESNFLSVTMMTVAKWSRRGWSRAVLGAICVACLTGPAVGENVLRIEVESASVRSIGQQVGEVWNLHSIGRVGEYFRTDQAGDYEITVQAYGSPAEEVWPEMTVRVDDRLVGTTAVDTVETTSYTFPCRLEPGIHAVWVSFTNDRFVGTEDRNLYLDRIEILAEAPAGTPVVVSEDEMTKQQIDTEAKVLKETEAKIRQYRMSKATVSVVDAAGNAVKDAKVTVEQTNHEFLFGCNIFGFSAFETEAENQEYRRLFDGLFNAATLPFYWAGYEREKGKPDYAKTEAMIAWCKARGIRMKGHPLLWADNAGIPPWSDGQPSPEVQEARVREIMTRYEGQIEFWEVVNEPAHLPSLKIDDPYRWARDASSEAYLIVNDYYVMADGFPSFLELLKKTISNEVPFDGIGIQAHEPIDMAFPLGRVEKILDEYAALGRELHITEFTPSSNGKAIIGSPWRGVWDEAQQAQYAEDFFRVCYAHPSVVAITWWDLCERHAWREKAGLLHPDLTPKFVYTRLKKLIHEEWTTNATGQTGGKGAFNFTGYHGTYRVMVEYDGGKTTEAFQVGRDGENSVTVRVAE